MYNTNVPYLYGRFFDYCEHGVHVAHCSLQQLLVEELPFEQTSTDHELLHKSRQQAI